MRTYTFGQCVRLMKVDPKVFRHWVKADLGLQEQEQVSRADRRVRYLTQEQLTRLADLHDRVLPAEDTLPEASERPAFSPGETKLLADRLDAVEHAGDATEQRVSTLQEALTRIGERITPLEQRVEILMQWTSILEHLSPWMTEIEARFAFLAQSGESLRAPHPDPQLVEHEVQHRQQLAEIEARYQQRIAELEAQLAAAQQAARPSSPRPASGTSKAKKLPKTLASRSAFAALHHVPDSVAARACQTGKIAAVNGKWLYQSRIIFQALGERGQQDFYQLFHTRPDFIPCHRCPHEMSESSHAASSTSSHALPPRSTDE